ncbi:MAG: phage tail tape measure protein [Paracoccus sp. (in: a-proteobacteria)]|uniref:phage tail tape measure protein n=1 Tax=Paracoccus TaxID=265 RepID=UPI00272D785B|nr:phage tail tape measure protein [Paracoccus sediminilitoris]
MALNDDVGSSLDLLEEDLGRNAQMTSEFEKELGRLRQSMLFTSREVTTLSSGLERGLGRAIDGLVLDGGKLSDALKTVGQSLADTVYSIAMKPVETALAGSLAGGVASIMGNGSFGQAITPFAKGGAFSQGRTTAVGGIASAPTAFPMRGGTGLMGEAGPEAIMPLQRGADGKLGVAAAGGGGGVNVTFNIQTPDVAGFKRSQSQIAAQMSRVLARGDRNS